MEAVSVYKVSWKSTQSEEAGSNLSNGLTQEYTLNELQLKLKDLDVTDLKIEGSIPPNLHTLTPNLKTLTVSYMPQSQDLHSLSTWPGLEVLDLSNNDLSSCPDPTVGCKSLKDLSLQSCQLEYLPSSISCLTQLTSLDISNNDGLNNIAEFEWPPSLKELNLSNCQLSDLSQRFAKLVQLQVLELSNSNFSAGLPEVITELQELKELSLPYCQLATLPDSFSRLQKLESLDLSCNRFTTLPDCIPSLDLLQVLNLNECQLKSLSERLDGLVHLTQLHVNGNNLMSLPDSLYLLQNLKFLNLADNPQLQTLNPKIKGMKSLERIDLKGCTSLKFPPYDTRSIGLHSVQQYYTRNNKQSLPSTIAVIGYSQAGKTSLINSLKQNERTLTNRNKDSWFEAATKAFKMEKVDVDNTSLQFVDFGGHEIYHVTYQLTFRESCIPVVVVSLKQYSQLCQESDNPREPIRRLMLDWISHLYLAQSELSKPTLIFTNRDAFDGEPEKLKELKTRFLQNLQEAWQSMIDEEPKLPKDLFHSMQMFEVGKTGDDNPVLSRIKYHLYELATEKCAHSAFSQWGDISSDILSLKDGFQRFDNLFDLVKTSYKNITREDFCQLLIFMNNCGLLLWYSNISKLREYVFTKIPLITELLIVLYDHEEEENWKRRLGSFRPVLVEGHQMLEKEAYEEMVETFRETGLADRVLFRYLIANDTIFKTNPQIDVAVHLLRSFKLVFETKEQDGTIGYMIPSFSRGRVEQLKERGSDIKLHMEIYFKGLSLPLHKYHQMTIALLEAFSEEGDKPDVKFNGAFIYTKHTNIGFIHSVKSRTVIIQLAGSFDKIPLCWFQLIEASRIVLKQTPSARTVTFYCPHCIIKGDLHPAKDENPLWFEEFITGDTGKMETGMGTTMCHGDQVPSVLKYPCKGISNREVKELQKHVTMCLKERRKQDSLDKRAAPDATEQLQQLCLLDASEEDVSTQQQSASPERLHNNDEVYKMSSPIKGRVLIINNSDFFGGAMPERATSKADVDSLTTFFKAIMFEVVIACDLAAKEMVSAVRMETMDSSHADYGMFTLVIMSHGASNSTIYGADMKAVSLNLILELLSPINFKLMRGRPKLVIVQTCGSHGAEPAVPAEVSGEFSIDNTLLICSTAPSNSATENQSGSVFIRNLVAEFARHASHKDVLTLMETVRSKIHQLYRQPGEHNDDYVRIKNWLTDKRKLYLSRYTVGRDFLGM